MAITIRTRYAPKLQLVMSYVDMFAIRFLPATENVTDKAFLAVLSKF